MALTRVTSGGIAEGVVIRFSGNGTPEYRVPGSPAITFENDTDTGVYNPNPNELAITTGGTARLIFKSDGQIVTGNGTSLGGTNPDFANATNIVLYVNQSDKNATDVETNDGGNINRPFKTIERGLVEAARKSYVAQGQDRFEAYTIMVLPGDYTIDNRPGIDVTTNPLAASASETPGSSATTGNLATGSAWRFNPRNGGVIVPRGTSIVGYDLRKTVIRPKYVPSPISDDGSITSDNYVISGVMYDAANMIQKARGFIVEQAFLHAKQLYPSIGNINETCKRDIGYIVDAVITDLREGGNANSFVAGEFYTDGTSLRFIADGTEKIATLAAFNKARDIMLHAINAWITNNVPANYSFTEITTGATPGLKPSYTSTGVNKDYSTGSTYDSSCATAESAIISLMGIITGIVSNPDTYTELYKKVLGVGFQTSIFKVTGGCYFWQMTFKDAKTNPLNSVTYNGSGIPTFTQATTPFYSHHRVVSFTYADQRTTDGELDKYYKRIDSWAADITVGNEPRIARPEEYTIVGDASTKQSIDTVNSASPYIFNCSLRSILGLCGMHTDGSKVKESSFKSMVVAQFTGISLQKDPNAYWQPRNATGRVYTDSLTTFQTGDSIRNVENESESIDNLGPIYADPNAEYKHDWRHFHIKASEGAFIQVVSVFAVGYADQFLAVNGGDMSITNSNSNFGHIALRAVGNKFTVDPPSAYGKITALIPPAGISNTSQYTEIYPIATDITWKANLGESAEKTQPFWGQAKTNFSTANGNFFKLYLEIPGVQAESDIPELVVESKDVNTGNIVVKRFLTFGANNNYNLFRDYYTTAGVQAQADCKISNQVDTATGGVSNYEAVIELAASATGDNTTNVPGNLQRQGYFWDPSRQKVYLKINPNYTSSRTYVADFLFSSVIETQFVTVTETLPDGSSQVVSRTEDVNVLEWWDSFPGSITSAKFVDARAANPNDLLWRVKYVIPKDYRDPDLKVLTPKPPEKRFIIKGTAPGNDGYGIPYSSYRFTIWDVQEIDTWERDVRDGVYYLTVLRADVDKFMDGDSGSYKNSPITLTRDDQYQTIVADGLSELYRNDNNYRVSTNVNYLYPSTNEEGNITNARTIWNPPQTDSRCIVEYLSGQGANGAYRPKDVSVPNKKYYNTSVSTTPFYEVPALTSVTAEACHRLVAALNLCYVKNVSTTSTQIKVAPVCSWDARTTFGTQTINGTANTALFNSVSTTFNIYGDVSESNPTNYRWGSGKSFNSTSDLNQYGVNGSEEDRKIVCCSYSPSVTNITNGNEVTNESNTILSLGPVVPLYRPSILRASSHTWEYIGIGPGNYSTGFPNLQTRVLKPYEQFIVQGYENGGGFIASSGTNSAGDFYIGNQVIQAGGQSTTTLNVPKVRKSSESNSVDFTDIENRIANNVINVIASENRSSASQNLLKGLSNFFTTARLTVSDRANIQTLYITDKLYIANTKILNGDKFPEGGPEGYGFAKGARPEKTGFIATDTNDRLYVSPKFLDAWRIKKKILSASNVNLDNNRIYIEPLSRTFINSIQTSLTTALTIPTLFNGSLVRNIVGGVTYGVLTITGGATATSLNLYVGMKIAQYVTSGSAVLTGEARIKSIDSTTQVTLENVTAVPATSTSGQFYGIDRIRLFDTSGLPPFGRIDLEMSINQITAEDYILDSGIKYYFNPTINISLQYDDIDYTNNTLEVTTIQNYLSYYDYVRSVLPASSAFNLHTITRNYSSVLPVIDSDATLTDTQYLSGTITGVTAHPTAGLISNTSIPSSIVDVPRNDFLVRIGVSSTFYNTVPSRGAVTIRRSVSGSVRYTTLVYFKNTNFSNQLCILRRIDTQSKSDSSFTYSTSDPFTKIFFTGSTCYASYGDKWTFESAFIPSVETITEDVDIESATLYTLPEKPVPYTGDVDTTYTDSIVPNPVTSKALGANLQTKRAVKTFQPFETLTQAAKFAEESAFGPTDEIEILMKPGYYRLVGSTFPCQVRINGSGVTSTTEQYSKEFAKRSAGRIGGYALTDVRSGDSVNFFRSADFSNNYAGRTDLLYVSTGGRNITSTGGLDISNVHFLGLNEAITRNEILDNSYSDDTQVIISRRRVRKAWYVKKSTGFPTSTAGVLGGLGFHATYASTTGKPSFSYTVNDAGLTDESGVIVAPAVDVNNVAKDARYMVITFTATNFSSTSGSPSDNQRFNWIKDYVIPGTTLFYFPNNTGTSATVDSTTRKTRVLDVRKNFTGTTLTSIQVYVAMYDGGGFTSEDEDLNISEINDLTNGLYFVFVNRDGDEFVTLTYNWCLEMRRQLLPKTFTTSGEGYDPTSVDTPEIYGIIAGYTRDTLNLVIDLNPTADFGGIRTFSFTTAGAAAGDETYNGITPVSPPTSGGTGAQFTVTRSGGVYSVLIAEAGSGYKIGDIITLSGTAVGGGSNITVTVGAITPAKSRYTGAGIMGKHPSILVKIGDTSEEYSVTIPTTPNGFLRTYGFTNDRFYLLEVNSAVIGSTTDNIGVNGTVVGGFSGYGFSDINGYSALDGGTFTFEGKTYPQSARRKTVFSSRAELDAVAKYNLYQSGGNQSANPYGYYRSGALGMTTRGREIFINYAQNYRISRKKFPTSAPPSVGNLGTTLIRVNGIPGSTNQVTLSDVTVGAFSDSSDRSNTYGGGYNGGLIAINNGQINIRGLRIRGNLILDWSSLLTAGGASRLNSNNKFGYGHSVDLIEPRETSYVTGIGANNYRRLNVSKDDINFQYYTTYTRTNNMYIEPNFLPTGKRVDYDSRAFPITTIAAIPKFDDQTLNYKTQVILDEKFSTQRLIYASSGANTSGYNLRYNNTTTTIPANTPGGHPNSAKELLRKTLVFTLPYSTENEQNIAENIAKNVFPNFTKIVRFGNTDSVLATVTQLSFYNQLGVAYFEITFSGNIEYNNLDKTDGTPSNWTGFELQLLTNYIPSQRFNYLATLTTRYKKIANSDVISSTGAAVGTYSRLEIGYDAAQKRSVFAENKDLKVEYIGNGIPNITRASVVTFTNTNKAPAQSEGDKIKVLMETDASGKILSMDIISLGINNNPDEISEYSTGGNGYKLTVQKSARVRTQITDIDYEMFAPGEVTVAPSNNTFIVNNFIETSLTGIKASLQRAKSIIAPGNYILYGGQYYKIAKSQPNKPYLSVYQYVNPANIEDIRTSLVVRLEEESYNITYSRTLGAAYNNELITRFELYEDDNVLRYWPDAGRLEIGELELADFTKQYIDGFTGYRLTLDRSNTKYWPSYIHDWDGIDIVETIIAGDPTAPTLAAPGISVNNVVATELRLADPVDATCSTYKRIKSVGYEELNSQYFTHSGIATTNRAYVDIVSSTSTLAEDFQKYEIGQTISIPFRNLQHGYYRRGYNNFYDSYPQLYKFKVTASVGTEGSASSTNREGDNLITGILYNTKPATTDQASQTNDTSGRIYFQNIAGMSQILNSTNTYTGTSTNRKTTYQISDYVDPLSVVQATRGIDSLPGVPLNGNLTTGEGTLSGVTLNVGSRTITTTSGIGIVPGLRVIHPNLSEECRISTVRRTGTSPNFTYEINLNSGPTANITNGTITFAANEPVILKIDHPLLADLPVGTEFHIVPTFNQEGTTLTRFVQIYKSRIVDIQAIGGSDNVIRLYLADPLTFGGTNYITDAANENSMTHPDSRHYGFCSINMGGWSYPRSGGSYFNSNAVRTLTQADQLKLPNYSNRIKSGDILRYTYEANTVIQGISTSSVNLGRANNFLRLSSIAVDQGDSIKALFNKKTEYYGTRDIYRTQGTYVVTHRRYLDQYGDSTDDYRFNNSYSTAGGTFFTTYAKTTDVQASGGASTITLTDVSGIVVGDVVTGTNIGSNRSVTAINGNIISISPSTTGIVASGTTLTFYGLSTATPTTSYSFNGTTYYIDYGISGQTSGSPTPAATAISVWTQTGNAWGTYYFNGTTLVQNTTDPWKQSIVLSGPKDKPGVRNRQSFGENAEITFTVDQFGGIETLSITNGGTGYRINDYLIIKGGLFNFNNPRYSSDLYLYISKVDPTGRILSFIPRFRLSSPLDNRIVDFDFVHSGATPTWTATNTATVSISAVNHGYVNGDIVNLTFSLSTGSNIASTGQYKVINATPDAFNITNPTSLTGTNTGNVNIGTDKFYYQSLTTNTAATTSSTILPVSSVSGINVGDKLFGLGTNVEVVSVDSDTQITLNTAVSAPAPVTLTVTNYISTGTTTITATVSSTTGILVGDVVVISGATGTEPTKLNGTWEVASVPSGTTFTFVVNTPITTGTYTTGLGTAIESTPLVFTTFLPDETMYIDNVNGSDIFLMARYTINGLIRQTIEYTVSYLGGFTAGQRVVFTTPKPSLKTVSGVVTAVTSVDANGYSTVTVDTADNILYSTHPTKEDWLSVSDILVSHQNDLFAYDGPVAQRFIHSEYGGGLQFSDFSIWNSYYRNGSENKGYGIYGSFGWVGNFARSIDGARMIGLTSSGALSINWSRQRANSIWQVAQPIRPGWTHTGVSNSTELTTSAFSPNFAYVYCHGSDTFFNSAYPFYVMENGQAITNAGQPNTIKHTNLNTENLLLTLNNAAPAYSPTWSSGFYHTGGIGSLNYGMYKWSSTFDSTKPSRIRNLNKVSWRYQDAKFRGGVSGKWGDLRAGTGVNTRLQESMIMNYVQPYQLCAYDSSRMVRVANYTITSLFSTALNTTGASGSNGLVSLTFAPQGSAPYFPGQKIIVSGMTPASYNGTWTVVSCSTTNVTFYSNASGNQTVAGTITPIITDINFNANIFDGRVLTTGTDQIVAGKDYFIGGVTGAVANAIGTDYTPDVDFTVFGAPNNKVGTVFTATITGIPPIKGGGTARSFVDMSGKISKNDAIYTSADGVNFTFIGFVNSILNTTRVRLSAPIAAISSAANVYVLRVRGLKTTTFDNSVTNRGLTNLKGENVLSSEMAGCNQYNVAMVISRRTYNTTPLINTENTVQPIGNRWWWGGGEVGHLSVRPTFGDLSAFEWTPMNINMTRFNKKVHLESTVTVNASGSTIGLDSVYI